MSIEALNWALNLAPVPNDPSGRPNPACAAVLIGLANHASPDGTAAFPSAQTLMRYTRLSERTVRTALDRLQEAGVIRPCDPRIVAAHITRADQRPQGWDLGLALVRTDLSEREIVALSRQFPGIQQRIASEVQRLHPVSRGATGAADGVQPAQERGAAVAPEPSSEPPMEPNTPRPSDGAPSARGTRLPEDWAPDATALLWAADHGVTDEEVRRWTEEFRDYWIAQPGAKGRRANWTATWRNKIRHSIERRPAAGRQTAVEATGAILDRAMMRAEQGTNAFGPLEIEGGQA